MRRPDLGVYPPPSASPPSDNFLSLTLFLSLSSLFRILILLRSRILHWWIRLCVRAFTKRHSLYILPYPLPPTVFPHLPAKLKLNHITPPPQKKTERKILVSMQFEEKMHPQKMGFREYIEALEEERKKIQVFPRELPLSLELVTQAIEACKQQQLSGTTTEYNLNGQSECSEQTSIEEGFVFEEFIPMKKRVSPDCDDEDDEQHSSHKKNKNTTDKKKSDWLRSVQLWNPNPTSPKEDVPRKTNVVEVKTNGGAFQPFHKEEIAVGKTNESSACKAPTSPALPSTSSTGPVVESSKREEKGQGLRKQRRCWSQELHKRFLHALQQLGGADSATPKQIRELMNVDGLTNDEVKSHLQKFRLHTRRSPVIHNNGNSQTAPLFLVGNIFVQPPPEYAATAVATTGELTTITSPTGIYAPVAVHPPAVPTVLKPRFKQLEVSEHSHSEERANHSEGAVLSNSPASSSSTHTPTTSPRS